MEKVIVDTWEEAEIDLPFGARGQIYLPCPKCSHLRRNHRGKCLSIDVERGIFHCFNCDYRGGVRSHMSMTPRPKKEYKRPEPPPPADESNPLPQEAIDWFAKRGISEATVRRYGITVSKHWFPQINREAPCLAFPFTLDGILLNVKYRRASEKMFTQEKDSEPVFWGLDDIGTETTFCVIVEGEMDKLACYEAGIIPALSVPSGAPPEGSRPNLDYFASGEAIFDRVERVILALDGDGPGQGLCDELARRIGLDKCFRVSWPEGCKDANEVLMQYGEDALRDVIADAKPFPMEGIFTVSDVAADLLSLYEHGSPPGYEIGIPSLVDKYTVHLGYVTIVGGIPSHGKTSFLDQIAVNMSEMYHWKFALFSPESGKWERHVSRLMQKVARRPFFSGPTPRMTREEYNRAATWCDEHFYAIQPEQPSLDEILTKAKVLVRRDGVTGIMLDPWNTIESNKPKDQMMHEYIGDCLLKIQLFARNHNVHTWVSVHPRKMQAFTGQSQPIPTPYDFADSSMWYNRGDVIITIWRDISQPGSPVLICVQKTRSEEFGQVGQYELRYDPATTIYTGWDDFEQEPEVSQEDVRQPPDDWGNIVPLPGVWGDGR